MENCSHQELDMLNLVFEENDTLHFERELGSQGYRCIVGVDEVGRGPLAGPVVAACVQLPPECPACEFKDSKQIHHRQRAKLKRLLEEYKAPYGVGIVSQRTIDTINILQASLMAMQLAVSHFSLQHTAPDFILVDGKFQIPMETTPQLALIRGENRSASIAAASIIAKVLRDDMMSTAHKRYPLYEFFRHKGYPTKKHRQAIVKFGPCPIHRMTFKGVKDRDS